MISNINILFKLFILLKNQSDLYYKFRPFAESGQIESNFTASLMIRQYKIVLTEKKIISNTDIYTFKIYTYFKLPITQHIFLKLNDDVVLMLIKISNIFFFCSHYYRYFY